MILTRIVKSAGRVYDELRGNMSQGMIRGLAKTGTKKRSRLRIWFGCSTFHKSELGNNTVVARMSGSMHRINRLS